MPKRSSNSRVLVWPKKDEVIEALRRWAEALRRQDTNIVRIGYFGSLAHGGYGVGSDVDDVIVVKESHRPWMERPLDFPPPDVPVDADVLVYTEDEWREILTRGDRFAGEMASAVWV